MIEASASRPGYVRDHAIHHLTALLVGVEVLVKKVPQKASALRNSDGINTFHRRRRLRIVFQIGKKIAHRRQPHTNNCRILGCVHQFVNPAGNESGVQMHVMRIRL